MNNENYEEDEDNLNEQEDDDRLSYTLITLGLENLIHIFEENNISFIDLLLLSKEDLIELQLEMFQRNRIFHFAKLFSKYAKNYSISEISDFFGFNKQFIFNSAIYDRVIGTNNEEEEEYQNTGTFINDNNNNNNNNFSNNEIYNQENIFNSQRQINNFNHSDFDNEDVPEKLNVKKKEYLPKKYFNINNNNNNNYSKNNNRKIEEINKKNINKDKKVKGKLKETQKKKEKNNSLNENKRNNTNNTINYNNYSNDNLSYTYDSINNFHNSNVKTSKSNKAFQKYLEIQQETDSILEKLNKQKEDSEIIKHKYQNLLNKSKNLGPSKISKMIKELKNSMNEEMNDYEEEESKNNVNNENNNNDNIDINEEYEKLINRIEEIETIKMNNNSLEHLNQIKNYINEKGIYITFDDIDKINVELDKLMKIIYKKENLKKELENCNNKILESKKKLSDLDENGEFNKNFNVDEVEELDEEYDLDSKNNSDNKKRKK